MPPLAARAPQRSPSRRSVLVAAAAAALLTACAERTTIETFPPHHRLRPLQHGVFLPHGPGDGPAFTAMTGAAPQWILLFQDWAQEHPPLGALDAVRAQGATPLLTWEPWRAAAPGTVPAAAAHQPPFALTRTLAGDHDEHIRRWAAALASWGHDVVLRFAHEMNGDWYPWGTGCHGNTADQYVQAWHHVHEMFAAAGATEVRWCWAPNIPAAGEGTATAALADYFPGDDVVDLLGIDGYNWGSSDPSFSWTGPAELFGSGLDELRGLGTRLPIMVTETASAEGHGPGQSKADWITELFDYLVDQGDVRGVIWFQEHKERDWRVNSTSAAEAAYRQAVAGLR
ncbi:glycoside hydrolase family 26 protein [Kocuria sp. NPDC057446]|uniref:glycoside hydrolase family 26 protein n=1 Tax=Kocuria sp. NPDC057446 TaxID=3346137 RepID=UPI0036A310C8